jgi:hypothetical protein
MRAVQTAFWESGIESGIRLLSTIDEYVYPRERSTTAPAGAFALV